MFQKLMFFLEYGKTVLFVLRHLMAFGRRRLQKKHTEIQFNKKLLRQGEKLRCMKQQKGRGVGMYIAFSKVKWLGRIFSILLKRYV